jgi:hypothetical protein
MILISVVISFEKKLKGTWFEGAFQTQMIAKAMRTQGNRRF